MMKALALLLLLIGTAEAQQITQPGQAALTPLNRNPDFVLDQPSEGAGLILGTVVGTGSTFTDGWRGFSSSLGSNRLATQRVTASPPPGYAYSWLLTTQTTLVPSAAQFGTVGTAVEAGSMTTALGWGAAGALPITIDLLLKANNTGTYSFGVQNNDATRSYVFDCAVASINTWTRCSVVVPGDTSGTWTTTPGTSALGFLFTWACGSNFQTTAGAWAAGNFFCDSSSTSLSALAAGTVNLAAVHIFAGGQLPQYVPRDWVSELALARHFYRKTFPIGTAVAQSAGVAGALCTKNPIAVGDPSAFWPWDGPMYKSPTITTYNPSAANANWRDVTAAADATVSVDPATALSNNAGILIATSATVATLGDVLCIHAVADTKS